MEINIPVNYLLAVALPAVALAGTVFLIAMRARCQEDANKKSREILEYRAALRQEEKQFRKKQAEVENQCKTQYQTALEKLFPPVWLDIYQTIKHASPDALRLELLKKKLRKQKNPLISIEAASKLLHCFYDGREIVAEAAKWVAPFIEIQQSTSCTRPEFPASTKERHRTDWW